MKKQNNITPFETDVAKWYSDLVLQSNLISYAPVKGTMFFKPYGYAIWKKIEELFTIEFNNKGVQEVKFPLLFPLNMLKKEKDHIEGFAPEVLTVTKVGDKELNEHYVIRPTSEILFGTFFKEELNTYKQLPLKLNQWVNVMRWENNTRPFLRNSEFFWQEGHTIHETPEEASEFSKEMIDVYEKVVKKNLLLPVLKGEKSISERFAGAENTYTIEAILKDGQALQSGTSHFLGNKFGQAFDVKVQGRDNKYFIPYQTSWGVSTRLIGALIMTHSDNKGLRLPSTLAPYQVVVITLDSLKNEDVVKVSNEIKTNLNNHRVFVDDSDKGLGFKAQEWEVKGVPIRIEIGPRDLKENNVTIAIRNKEEKIKVKINEINTMFIQKILDKYDEELYNQAELNTNEKIVEVSNINDLEKNIINGKVCKVFLIDNAEFEKEIKEKFGATVRMFNKVDTKGKCIYSKKETNTIAYIARAY